MTWKGVNVNETKVRIIKAKHNNTSTEQQEVRKKRVVVYCRVSTNSDEQLESLDEQIKYFERMAKRNPDWRLVKIYSDEGKTGTSMKYRHNFRQMLEDCDNGLVDIIVTKSISRFARNALDCIKTIRKLKEKKIGVLFEKENIFTLDSTSEFVLTLLSAVAEEESNNISNNVRWGIKSRLSRGIFSFRDMLGYYRDKDKRVHIIEEEAEIVREAFDLFICGYSPREIADRFMAAGYLSKQGGNKWYPGSMRHLFENEKYIGACAGQKTYSNSFLDRRRIVNQNEQNIYIEDDTHEPIVEKIDYYAANYILERNEIGETRTLPFTGVIFCPKGNQKFRRKPAYYRDGVPQSLEWVCCIHDKRCEGCKITQFKENGLKEVCVETLNEWLADKESVISQLNRELKQLMRYKASGEIVPIRYGMFEIDRGAVERRIKAKRLEHLIDTLKSIRQVEAFDDSVMRVVLTGITVLGKSKIRIELCNTYKKEIIILT